MAENQKDMAYFGRCKMGKRWGRKRQPAAELQFSDRAAFSSTYSLNSV